MGAMPLRRATALLVLLAVLPVALVSNSVVRDGQGFAMAAGASGRGLLLAAGAGLAVAGLLHLWRRAELSAGAVLLGLAGAGWLVAEWDNPAASSDVVFTIGLVLWTVGPVLLTHAALAYPTGRLRSWPARVLVAAGYVVTLGVQGVATAVFFDPVLEGCASCPENLLAVAADPGRHQQLDSWGVRAGALWAAAAVVTVVVLLVRVGAARRRSAGFVLGATAVGLVAVTAHHVRNLERGYLGSEQADRDLWTVQGVCLLAVAVAVLADLVRQRRAHRALTGLVVDLSDGLASDSLEQVLAQRLGDPGVRLCFPAEGTQRTPSLVDSAGRPADTAALTGRRTELWHAGRHLATLVHRPGVLEGEDEVAALVSALHLGLDHERLQAQALAQLADLRESGRRLLDAATPNAGRWSATCTTGPSSGWSGSRWACGCFARAVAPARRSTSPIGRCRRQWRPCAPWVVGSTRCCWTTPGSGRRCEPWPRPTTCGSGPCRRSASPAPSRPRRTCWWSARCDAGPASVEMAVEDDGLRVRLVARAEPRAWGEVVDRVTTLGGRWSTSGVAAGAARGRVAAALTVRARGVSRAWAAAGRRSTCGRRTPGSRDAASSSSPAA